jgi:hypothetical protein
MGTAGTIVRAKTLATSARLSVVRRLRAPYTIQATNTSRIGVFMSRHQKTPSVFFSVFFQETAQGQFPKNHVPLLFGPPSSDQNFTKKETENVSFEKNHAKTTQNFASD